MESFVKAFILAVSLCGPAAASIIGVAVAVFGGPWLAVGPTVWSTVTIGGIIAMRSW